MIWLDEDGAFTVFGVPIRRWDNLPSGTIIVVSTPSGPNPLYYGPVLRESAKIPVRWRDEAARNDSI